MKFKFVRAKAVLHKQTGNWYAINMHFWLYAPHYKEQLRKHLKDHSHGNL